MRPEVIYYYHFISLIFAYDVCQFPIYLVDFVVIRQEWNIILLSYHDRFESQKIMRYAFSMHFAKIVQNFCEEYLTQFLTQGSHMYHPLIKVHTVKVMLKCPNK